jgi:cholesterol transport system auxiliary component
VNTFIKIIFVVTLSILSACSVKSINNLYKLDAYSNSPVGSKNTGFTILVSQPEAVAGYQTEQMLYIKKPFGLNPFAKSAWVAAPANMLHPLFIQSLHDSHYFYAVVSPPYADKADYRLDTQLIELQQNFLVKPSRMELVVKVVLTQGENDRVMGSRIIRECIPCPEDTPYGGVLAANMATTALTKKVTSFVIHLIQQNKRAA